MPAEADPLFQPAFFAQNRTVLGGLSNEQNTAQTSVR